MPPQNTSKVPVGAVLAGKFRITKEIGRGGMAAVYEAENISIGKRVAVKILAAELITSRIVRERFLREARAAAAIRSPYICDVYDSGMFEERPFLVMELLEGETLYEMMMRERQMNIETTVRVVTHAARGLGKAHESNVVHRDLKPENIFLTTDEEGRLLAKIVDFGLAKFYEPTTPDSETVRLTREGALFGTPAYMSPEQAKGKGEVDLRSDLWALACIVYECLTAQTVWNVEQGVAMILAQIASAPIPKPSRLRPDLPPAFEPWFTRALDRDPNKRFQTAREFADKLAVALLGGRELARSVAVSSDDEGMVVDELISGEGPPSSDRPTERVPPPPASVALPEGTDATAEKLTSVHAAGRRQSRAISLLLLVAALSVGAYAVWLYRLHPPGSVQKSRPAKAAERPPPPPSASASSAPRAVEPDAYALKLGRAQELLATGQPKLALDGFREALKAGGAPAARSLLSRASFAIEEATGSCKVTGIGRPRPFGIEVPPSRPVLAHTARGTVFAWIDNHQDVRQRQAYAVLLDDALRRTSPEIAITPEAVSARQIELVPAGDGLALLYWEDSGNEPGVYVRLLGADGRIASPARRISAIRKGDLSPALTPGDGDSFWAVWQEEIDKGSTDIVARPLDSKLEPTGPPTRLTAMAPVKGSTTPAGGISTAVAQGNLQIAFSVSRGPERLQIMLLRVGLADPTLKAGLPAATKAQPENADRALGHLQAVSPRYGKNTTPLLACPDEGCFVAWDDEKAGASVAFVEREKGQMLWHREFGAKSARPALATAQGSTVVSWYEDSRLHFTTLSRDGIGAASVLGRVNGFQPQPDIAPGDRPGTWYVSWRDYESARLEVFVLRAECQ